MLPWSREAVSKRPGRLLIACFHVDVRILVLSHGEVDLASAGQPRQKLAQLRAWGGGGLGLYLSRLGFRGLAASTFLPVWALPMTPAVASCCATYSLSWRGDAAPVSIARAPPRPGDIGGAEVAADLGADARHQGWLECAAAAATRLGLVAQPLGRALDIPASRASLRALLGTMGAPQMLLRIGVGTAVASSPRRPVAEVLR